MTNKKSGVLILSVFLSLFLIGVVSADSCSIMTATSCSSSGGTIAMQLSSTTNAHGATATAGAPGGGMLYTYVLCCDFTGSTSCTGTNKIIGLSSTSNAHAEIPENDNYGTDICYGNLVCEGISGDCETGYNEILSLSGNTNAHIGGPGDYNIKICCEGVTAPPEPEEAEVYWADEGGEELDTSQTQTYYVAITTLRLVATGLSPGTTAVFEIYESDSPAAPDEIRVGADALTKTVNSEGAASVNWTISAEDKEAGLQYDNDEPFELYFVVNDDNDLKSDILSANIKDIPQGFCSDIFSCSNYDNSINCGADLCGVAEASVHANAPDITCGDGYDCGCWWDESKTENQCGPYWDGLDGCGNGEVDNGEECDGSDWGSIIGCGDFDEFIGGTLKCNNCMFDTSECTGGTTGICGDDEINTGETCDGNNWGSITGCEDFDEFVGGTLACYESGEDNACHFDTSGCSICPDEPTAEDVCEGVTIDIYDNLGEEVCRTVTGTADCPATCPTGPDSSTICEGKEIPIYDEDGFICGKIIGTKDCPPNCDCPFGPDSDTICEGTGVSVEDECGNICRIVWGTKDCSGISCPNEPTADDICEGVIVPVENENGDICRVVVGTADCSGISCPAGSAPSAICEGEYELVENSIGKICDVIWGTLKCEEGAIPTTIGTCKYYENADEDPEGCADGYLSYSWGATWSWGENIFSSNPDGTDYVEVPLGSNQWHYDPLRKYLKCKDGSGEVECPAQVQLPFFGIHSLIVAIILIIVVYLILNMKKHKKR